MVRQPEEMCELIVAKHRNGNTGTIEVKWIGGITTFVDVGPGSEEKSLSESAPPPTYKDMPPISDDEAPAVANEVEMQAVDVSDDDLSDIF